VRLAARARRRPAAGSSERTSTFEGWRASLIKRGARQGIGLIEPGLHLCWHSDVTASLGVLAPSIVVCSFR
jgi:hypothetical protein